MPQRSSPSFEILGQLERTDVDVDVLAAQVQRGPAHHLLHPNDRIGNARLQIEQVITLPDD